MAFSNAIRKFVNYYLKNAKQVTLSLNFEYLLRTRENYLTTPPKHFLSFSNIHPCKYLPYIHDHLVASRHFPL